MRVDSLKLYAQSIEARWQDVGSSIGMVHAIRSYSDQTVRQGGCHMGVHAWALNELN
jgi:hypothetical protein